MAALTQGNLPMVSVIIPAFNNRRFIQFAIESIFRQTYPEDKREVIIVDDGSTDDIAAVAHKFGEGVHYLRQEHRGIASARNAGMAHARGKIITFLDSDDLWHDERLEKVVNKFLDNPSIGMVYHPIEMIDSDGATVHKNFYAAFSYVEGLSGWMANEIASGKIFSGGSSFSFRKDLVDMIFPLPEDIRRGIDYYMATICSCYAPVEYIPEILGKYRLHTDNVTMSVGLVDILKSADMNKDFAHTRQRIAEEISLRKPAFRLDLDILRQLRAKEMIFFYVLTGRRLDAIAQIPTLFKGSLSPKNILRGITVGFMTFFIPAFLYPAMVKFYGIIRGRMSSF